MVDLKNEEPRQSPPQHEKVLNTEYTHCDENGNLCNRVRIHPEFEKLIHPLSKEELRELEHSIKQKGCLDPIKVWQGYIIDGHHRYQICEKNNVSFEALDMDFDDEWDVKRWMIDNQLGRRNLTDAARIEYASLRVDIIQGVAQRNQKENRFQKGSDLSKLDSKTRRHFEKKAEQRKVLVSAAVGSMAGVSASTVKRYNYVKQHAEPETLKALQQGELVPFGKKGKKKKLSVGEVYRKLKAKEKKNYLAPEELEEETQKDSTSRENLLCGSPDPRRKNNLNNVATEQPKEVARKAVSRKNLPERELFTRIVTHPIDELHRFVDPDTIDVIITEPPCKEEDIDLFDKLGDFARHALKDGGICVAICGNRYFVDFAEMLRAHLDYVWMGNLKAVQCEYELPGGTITATWNPVLIFSKGERSLKPFEDGFDSLEKLVEALTYQGETICDPFCGEGSIGEVCLEKKRSFVGSDIDVEKTLALKETLQPKKA